VPCDCSAGLAESDHDGEPMTGLLWALIILLCIWLVVRGLMNR
jgi:hypothetical protein